MDLTQETQMIWLKIALGQIMENEQSITKGYLMESIEK